MSAALRPAAPSETHPAGRAQPWPEVCVAGLGYIGLPLATALAEAGVRVHAYDIDRDRVAAVQAGRCPIEEPALSEPLADAVTSGLLAAADAPTDAEAFIVTVPTPVDAGSRPDLGYVRAAVEAIAPHLSHDSLVIIESTCPVGATEQARAWARAIRPELFEADLAAGPQFVYCPERVIPGDMVREMRENDRVMGGLTPEGAERARALYQRFCVGEIVTTDARTAETVKLAENAFRDVNIAFANELSMICAASGVDAAEAIAIANRHPRVNILTPGVGVGGHCIAVDPWFLIRAYPERARLMAAARSVNLEKTRFALAQIRRAASRLADDDAAIACLGLAYKPNVGDLRESPSVEIAETLRWEFPGRVLAVEPHADPRAVREAEERGLVLAPYEDAVARADLIVELTPHAAFADLDRRATGKTVLRFHR